METAWTYIKLTWEWMMDNLIYINLILSIIIVFFQRRDPKSVWTWLLALYFIPVFGILFYLFLGQDMRKSKMFRIKEVEDRVSYTIKKQENYLRSIDFCLTDPLSRDYGDLVVYNLETSGAVLTTDNIVAIFTDGLEKFEDLRAELAKAEHFIHLQYYIIKNDEVFDRLRRNIHCIRNIHCYCGKQISRLCGTNGTDQSLFTNGRKFQFSLVGIWG